jgi:Raf kinase inhibitor-like YbhB/YbcL family protein
MIADDPDAPGGTFTHWVVYNLPGNLTGLAEGVAKTETIDSPGSQGVNGYQRIGYDGPCPPAGPAHRYYFTVYALDIEPTLPAGLDAPRLRSTMQGHILGEAQWVGKYGR